ncbi:MAG: hypothetical protein GC154_03110 [bacterium]|nr:hypothetical protein [bacterium]
MNGIRVISTTVFASLCLAAWTPNAGAAVQMREIQTFDAGLRTTDLAAGDLDGDGDIDLAFTNMVGNSIGLAFNQGDGSFADFVDLPLPQDRKNPLALDVGDVDGDGVIDIVVAYNQTIENSPQPFKDSAVMVLWGAPDGTYTPTILTMFGVPSSVLIADVNADGRNDVVVGNNGGFQFDVGFIDQVDAGIVIWTNKGSRSFNAAREVTSEGSIVDVAAGDINGDGVLDVFGSNQGVVSIQSNPIAIVLSGVRVTLFTNTGGQLQNTSRVNLTLPPWDVEPFDSNGDQYTDFAVAIVGESDPINVLSFTGKNASVNLYENTGTGFTLKSKIATPGVTYAVSPHDFDGDGDVDVAATVQEISGNVLIPSLWIYEQTEPGVYTETDALPLDAEPRYLETRDFDGDGDLDVAVLCVVKDSSDATDSEIGKISVFENLYLTPSSAIGWELLK